MISIWLARRYNRQGVTFTFDRATKQFHYDGAAWREIIRRYPKSPEVTEAKKRLEAPQALQNQINSQNESISACLAPEGWTGGSRLASNAVRRV